MELTNQKYRVSEVGIIPVEWEVMHLGDIANVIGGGTPSTFNDDYWNGDINWFTPTEIGLKKYSYESLRKITKKGLENSSARILPIGTILLTSRAGIGDVSILMNEACTNQGFQSLVAKGELNNEFLYYVVSTLKKVLLQNASGSTFLEISPKKVKSILVALPSTLKEQTAIATALSDTDTLIEILEKLIEKKRNIKQGAMQELLTPKDTWFCEPIKRISLISTGAKNTQDKIDNGEFPFFVRSQIIEKINSYSYDGEAVLVAGDGVGTGKVMHYFNGKFDFHQRVYKISDFQSIISGYFFFLYFKNNFLGRIMQMTAKSSVDSIRMEMISDMKIYFPSISEQSQITAILSDMDKEIEALEQNLNKYKMIKQGMMQVLLTGKIRLL